MHPGLVATELARHAREFVGKYLPVAVVDALFDAVSFFSWTPDDGALTQLYTACSPDVPAKKLGGKYFHPSGKVFPASQQAQNRDTQALLWDFTAKILGSRGFSDYEAI